MRKALMGLAVGLSLAVVSMQGTIGFAQAAETGGAPASAGTYALLFREGVLDRVAESAELDYAIHRDGWSAPRPEAAADATKFDGSISLKSAPDDNVVLTIEREGRKATAGTFPRSVGNPIIMYFLESVLRDMANQAGGSPFYIRNRIKAALLEKSEVKPVSVTLNGRDVQAQEVTIHPFAKDEARARMFGFADLELVAVLSEDVPGWYYSLSAKAPSEGGGADPGYSNRLTLEPEAM
ncbi:MAG: hypothetical protein K9H25_16115 [Rhodospirillum sp.]|nr:hypothetical protein [Rhodospirillum sp.]MCF8489669.1 hypothetical protein [Rhodospirillum sp.]MCF8501491.1 hypothetical protein [Rhodospirillum sp.]